MYHIPLTHARVGSGNGNNFSAATRPDAKRARRGVRPSAKVAAREGREDGGGDIT